MESEVMKNSQCVKGGALVQKDKAEKSESLLLVR
jgi:hypothetical protein